MVLTKVSSSWRLCVWENKRYEIGVCVWGGGGGVGLGEQNSLFCVG